MILIHLKVIFARVWVLIRPKKGPNLIFPHFASLSQDLRKNLGKVKIVFDRPKCILSEKAIKPM